MGNLEHYIAFIKEAEGLKSVLRTAWTSGGSPESTAEHSWRLALLAVVVLEEYPELDALRILKMCLIHDLGELYDGDISAQTLPDPEEKYRTEKAAVDRLFGLLPKKLEEEMLDIWEEYNNAATNEALLVKALDKSETILQHIQGQNPDDGFDYEFNLSYGKEYFEADDFLRELRVQLDQGTCAKIKHQI